MNTDYWDECIDTYIHMHGAQGLLEHARGFLKHRAIPLSSRMCRRMQRALERVRKHDVNMDMWRETVCLLEAHASSPREPCSRFRADPARVRVSVRRLYDGGWLATVAPRDALDRHVMQRSSMLPPGQIITKALQLAVEMGMEGIDLSMGQTYPHPHYVPPEQKSA